MPGENIAEKSIIVSNQRRLELGLGFGHMLEWYWSHGDCHFIRLQDMSRGIQTVYQVTESIVDGMRYPLCETRYYRSYHQDTWSCRKSERYLL